MEYYKEKKASLAAELTRTLLPGIHIKFMFLYLKAEIIRE